MPLVQIQCRQTVVAYRWLVYGLTVCLWSLISLPAQASAAQLQVPRQEIWKRIDKAIREGKPKTAGELLTGVEQAAATEEAWDEVGRAIATRVLVTNADRPGDDPQRLIDLAAATKAAAAPTRSVLEAIRANWTWGFFQANRWRFSQRTSQAAEDADRDLAEMASWDLRQIVDEIQHQFGVALADEAGLKQLPVDDWAMLVEPGSMGAAYRPTIWDVVVHDAIAFYVMGERGLAEPEDAFELEASSPALQDVEAFRRWRPAGPDGGKPVSDTESPLLAVAGLYQALLAFHADDTDRTAFLAVDLDRLLWAGGVAVADATAQPKEALQAALKGFIAQAADHPLSAQARFHLASSLREDDPAEARAIALAGSEAHPNSVGGKQCRNLIKNIESKEIALETERAWAAPWPTVTVTYRNLTRVHLRLARADWEGRLAAGKPAGNWLDAEERRALLALPAVKTFVADLPATTDYRQAMHQIPVATALDATELEPGAYWLLASHRDDFGDKDNVVATTLIWVSRLALVNTTNHSQPQAQHAGYVVESGSGEPVAGATVTVWQQQADGGRPPRFEPAGSTQTNAEGRYELAATTGRLAVLVATASIAGHSQTILSEPQNYWHHRHQSRAQRSIVVMSDRGIYRPGQLVQFKGVLLERAADGRSARAIEAGRVDVVLQDANRRVVAKLAATTNRFGSFQGSFPIPTGALPGGWSVQARGSGGSGSTAIRVEEYKRPKFKVELAAPTESVQLNQDVRLTGTATSYTGLAVAGAKVVWRVERQMRFPIWCRWVYPWLPFDSGSRRIARGTATTDGDGTFTIQFPAVPDRSVPQASLPVFTYAVTADVTDTAGETRSADRRVAAGYTDVEATVEVAAWQASHNGEPAAVPLTITTTSLDGAPRGVTGRLRVVRLVQPPEVSRGDLTSRPIPYPAFRKGSPVNDPAVSEPDPANPETWAEGEEVFAADDTTDAATGKAVATANLSAGIYRAIFEVAGDEARPAVQATRLIEVVDPAASTYGIKRAFVLRPEKTTVAVDSELVALVGTGYEQGRMLVELVKAGRVLERFWTEPNRTQTPIRLKLTDAHRGGVTVRAWMVRDGRLHHDSQTITVPWTNKQLSVTWERFTRKLEPAAQEIWRATIRTVADPLAGPSAATVAEMAATLYDQSLDALASHAWPQGFLGLFAGESSSQQFWFTNDAEPLQPILGSFGRRSESVSISYHRLRAPFGSPLQGGFDGMLGGRMLRRGGMMPMAAMAAPAMAEGMAMEDAPMAADAMPPEAMMKQSANAMSEPESAADTLPDGADPAAATAPPPRRKLAETAFFLPTLVSDTNGTVTLEFTLPDTLTTWQFKAVAHDEQLRSGVLFDTCVTAKDLMVEPQPPRFLREGDVVQFPVKVSNASTGRLTGRVRLALFDARSNDSREALLDGPAERTFDLAAGASEAVFFTIRVADGTDVLRYLATGSTTGSARPLSDGEEALLPVLPRKVLVTETIPVTVRGGETRHVRLEKLAAMAQQAEATIENQSLVVQAVSNPAWYAVMALPYLMEETCESIDTLFQRLYANAYARHLVAADPRIAQVFDQWRGTDALESPLEKNSDLVQTLLAETPWFREATDEREARARIALLFDKTRVENEIAAAIARLNRLRNPDGGWPWFPGGRSCDSITLSIAAGFGRLRANGVKIDVTPALASIPWIDQRLIEEKELFERRAERARKAGNNAFAEEPVLTSLGVFALYARSFFLRDVPLQGPAVAAHAWCVKVGRQSWTEFSHNRSQGQLAIALARNSERETALSIIESLRQRAVGGPRGEQTADRGEDNWQGMWWRQRHPGWWSWLAAPIETQSVLIEAFDEVAGDAASVEAMKAWLVQQKRTSRWSGSQATANAVGVLLGRGRDLLGDKSLMTVTVGGESIKPGEAGASDSEAGTGLFETRFVRREIGPAMGEVTFAKPAGGGLAFGGVHWQYLDAIENVEAAGRTELAVTKALFKKTFTKAGPVLEPVPATTAVEVGDELVVRLVVTSDRAYEFLELADHRPSLTEPVDVLSGWKWSDGVGWYQVTRDASTQLFFERLPPGTHVFEYSLRVAHRGEASSGFATIRSRYAPEFSARSQSLPVTSR